MGDFHADEQVPQHPLKDVPIEITVSVGRATPTVKELLALGNNSVLALDRRVDDPVELYVGERLVARGALEESDGVHQPAGALTVRLTEVVHAQTDSSS